MKNSESLETTKKYPHFGSMYIAVFNCRENHIKRAREEVIRVYGKKEWKRVLRAKRTGVMAIFAHKQFPALVLFAELVALYADHYHFRFK